MNLRTSATLLAIAPVALLFAACQGDTTTIVQPAQEAPGIAASGRGEVTMAPDTGYFQAGVEVRDATVAGAREKAAVEMDAVINSIKSNGVDAKDIKTTQFLINPQYEYPQGGQPRITGYIVANVVEVKVLDLDRFSEIIDEATAAGGNDTRIQGIRFDIEDNAKALEQAREMAMSDAKAKAEQLARLAGVQLGTPLSVVEQTSSEPPPETFADADRAGAATGAPTVIEPGTGAVVVAVAVRWAIED